jgi:hypothetical protein
MKGRREGESERGRGEGREGGRKDGRKGGREEEKGQLLLISYRLQGNE